MNWHTRKNYCIAFLASIGASLFDKVAQYMKFVKRLKLFKLTPVFSSFYPFFFAFTLPGNYVLFHVMIDHGYSKPWSAHPDASHARPVKLMYMQRVPRNQTAENSKYVKL